MTSLIPSTTCRGSHYVCIPASRAPGYVCVCVSVCLSLSLLSFFPRLEIEPRVSCRLTGPVPLSCAPDHPSCFLAVLIMPYLGALLPIHGDWSLLCSSLGSRVPTDTQQVLKKYLLKS
ncbi:hypothetical protein H1C71_015601 [Ictidomys tridecemlineatus]|nr:hypothetical protein H1C71_015601 [Ictidomys tridecemlineatus]